MPGKKKTDQGEAAPAKKGAKEPKEEKPKKGGAKKAAK
eukprot:CAMPEP_0176185194 /NCGR_PEP_ID=MMETSP0121_2-20121125/1224_1 /TAXON_ID=160619 /ORGANISM="Kryptoperidinium foliaceum, Strain CCMP 1326" /LENGTH=37 /DNA_ID= /DNA_START= /DNA_END= /DNA_ORIENTATION=